MKIYIFRMLSIPVIGMFLLTGQAVNAQAVKISAVGAQSYADKATAAVKDKALEKAKLAAFKKYMAKQPKARKSVYRKLESKFRATLDTIIIEHSVQKEKDDTESKKYKIAIIASIDTNEVDTLFDDLASAGSKLSGEFAYFFLARVQESSKSFDAKRTVISSEESANKVRETSVQNSGKSVDAVEQEKFSKKQTGGSTVVKRAKIAYAPHEDLTDALQEVVGEYLGDAGFEPIEYTELGDDVPTFDELMDDGAFKKNGKLPKKIEKAYRNAAKKAEMKYFGVGFTSVSVPKEDTVQGNLKLTAEVNFKVYDLSGKRAKTIATVKRQIVTVRGDEPDAMQTAAVNKAAKLAIDTITGKLQKKALK
jgi:hypothetical protein